MDSIRLNNQSLRIAINNDPDRVLVFNPNDPGFAQRFYRLIDRLDDEKEKINTWAENFQKNISKDCDPIDVGRQVNAKELEVMTLLRNEIDAVFGAGTSQMAFGDSLDIDMVCQLLEGLTPFVSKARAERMARYTQNKAHQGVL